MVKTASTDTPKASTAAIGVCVLVMAASLAATPAALTAQAPPGPDQGTVSFDVTGGLSVPVAALDDFTETGGAFGGGIAVHLSQRVALQGKVLYQALGGRRVALETLGTTTTVPDIDVLHATGGVEVHFVDPETRWTGSLGIGAGIAVLDPADFVDVGPGDPDVLAAVQDLDNTYLAFRGGTELGYQATSWLNVFLEPQVYLTTVERADTQALADEIEPVDLFDVAWSVPIQAGVSFRIN